MVFDPELSDKEAAVLGSQAETVAETAVHMDSAGPEMAVAPVVRDIEAGPDRQAAPDIAAAPAVRDIAAADIGGHPDRPAVPAVRATAAAPDTPACPAGPGGGVSLAGPPAPGVGGAAPSP